MAINKIKNILFLNPPGDVPNSSPPLGLGYVATYLKSKLPAINVKITDLSVEKIELKYLITSFKPDIIGVTSITTIVKHVRLLLEKIRSYNPTIPIVIGGPHASALKAEIFNLAIDFAVVEEGEETLWKLIVALNSGEDLSGVDGIIYRKDDSIIANKPRRFIQNIDIIPKIDWSLLPMDKYNNKGTIISSRGCPYDCIFCSQLFGRSWRAHSPEYIFDVIKELIEKYHVNTIRFMDDNPLINKGRFKEICKLIINSGYDKKVRFELNHGTRINIVDYEVFSLLKQIGVRNIWLGLESAVPEVLELMRKKISLEDVTESIKFTHSCGFLVNAFITIGMPGDTYERSMETLRYVKEHNIDLVSPAVATPFPGTDLFDWVEKNGRWLNKDYETWYSTQSIIFDTEDFTKKERMKALNNWHRFCAFQRARLLFRRPKDSLRYILRDPTIIFNSIKNILGTLRHS